MVPLLHLSVSYSCINLAMANRFRRLLSFGSDSRNQNIVNSHEQRTGSTYSASYLDSVTNSVMPRNDIDILNKKGNTINMLTKLDFTINWPLLKIDY